METYHWAGQRELSLFLLMVVGVLPWFAACSSLPAGKVSLWRRTRRAQRLPPMRCCHRRRMVPPSSPSSSLPSNNTSGRGAAQPRRYDDDRPCRACHLRAPYPQALPSPWNRASRSPSVLDASALGSSFSAQDVSSTTANPPSAGLKRKIEDRNCELSSLI